MHAVETHPKRPDEVPSAYLARIAALAEKRLTPRSVQVLAESKSMPAKQKRLSDGEWNERNNALQAQKETL
jgi:hypothetical protein